MQAHLIGWGAGTMSSVASLSVIMGASLFGALARFGFRCKFVRGVFLHWLCAGSFYQHNLLMVIIIETLPRKLGNFKYANQPAKIKTITVIGGGIVGVAAALKLQLDGHKVRLIDRKEPGRETSYGNAGVLSDRRFMC